MSTSSASHNDAADRAVHQAARAVQAHLREGFYGPSSKAAAAPGEDAPRPSDPVANAETVKAAARAFGADAAGICQVDRAWLCAYGGGSAELDERFSTAVVMIVTMDAAGIRQSPGPAARAATSTAYMRMAVCASAMGQFLRELGYGGLSAGNDTALSVPLAVAAGLGRLGRNGMLIAPGLGPCVRICKVFTDMPLRADTAPAQAVHDACRQCDECARACPTAAIDTTADPTDTAPGKLGGNVVLRWPMDGGRCREFWRQSEASCATCIAACPLTRPPTA